MVKLTKIYTRGGDSGQTSLGGGIRIAKSDPRIAAIGDVDELGAAIGLARAHNTSQADAQIDAQIDTMLARIQNDLFDVGAELASPGTANTAPTCYITEAQTTRLESEIDALNAELAPLSSFVLAGGSVASAHLHMARTIARRAERAVCALAEGADVHAPLRQYLNRLSDLLFVMARYLNDKGARDVLWQPGENR